MKIDLNKLQHDLTDEQIIKILYTLGADRHDDRGAYIIFPTICHNEYAEEASMKLYYYKKDFRFHCYTECSDTFNIYQLIQRVFTLREGHECPFSQALQFLLSNIQINVETLNETSKKYMPAAHRYERKNRILELPTYNKGILNIYEHIYPVEWLEEGITKEAIDKYDIRYSISQNKIIIPHFNINSELIGIRGRALNSYEAEAFGKYRPVTIEGKEYNHPLHQNLYGLNLTRDGINAIGKVFVFEAEKSVLLSECFTNNAAVAVCGSNFNKVQLDILRKNCNFNEVVICFDKEYEKAGSIKADNYFNKLLDICKRYSEYTNLSFIFDREDLLREKDSPIDRGKDIFLKLYYKRIKTWRE